MRIYTVFQKKTSTYIIGYKLRNSCLILIIFDTKIPHIIWHRKTAQLYSIICSISECIVTCPAKLDKIRWLVGIKPVIKDVAGYWEYKNLKARRKPFFLFKKFKYTANVYFLRY